MESLQEGENFESRMKRLLFVWSALLRDEDEEGRRIGVESSRDEEVWVGEYKW